MRYFDGRTVGAQSATPMSYNSVVTPNTLQITIERIGACTEALAYELFNPIFGISQLKNANVFGDKLPITSKEGLAAFIADQNDGEYVYFDADGNLIIIRLDSVNGNCGVKISCKERPYQAVLKALENTAMTVTRNRMTYVSLDTITESHELGRATIFGADASNKYNPQIYFDPNQQQSKVLDITQEFVVDRNFFLRSTMPANETLISMTFTIPNVTSNGVNLI